jgi:hypothetical protein
VACVAVQKMELVDASKEIKKLKKKQTKDLYLQILRILKVEIQFPRKNVRNNL